MNNTASTQPREVVPGVFNHGRGQYSDSATGMNMPAGFTGQPSAQNEAAWQRLADTSQAQSMARVLSGMQAAQPAQPAGFQAPTVRHSGNDWQARNDLRNAEVSAGSIMNTRKWGGPGAENNPDVLKYKAMLASDQALRGAQPGMDQETMRQNVALQREGIQQQGANARAVLSGGLEQQKINTAADQWGFEKRGKSLVQAMQEQIATEQNPAKRQSIVQRLREIQGGQTADPYLVVPGGQQIDPTSQRAYNTPSSVFNRQTGQWIQQPGQGAAQAPAVGTVQRGYKFKGGDPASPSSWEKA